MSTLEIITAILLSVLQCAAFLLAISPATRDKVRQCIDDTRRWLLDVTQEQPQAIDHCDTCNRWSECNGVDRENCPLWRDDEKGGQ